MFSLILYFSIFSCAPKSTRYPTTDNINKPIVQTKPFKSKWKATPSDLQVKFQNIVSISTSLEFTPRKWGNSEYENSKEQDNILFLTIDIKEQEDLLINGYKLNGEKDFLEQGTLFTPKLMLSFEEKEDVEDYKGKLNEESKMLRSFFHMLKVSTEGVQTDL